ncbi:MAG: DUF3493 domain-containing protein [Calothrix sp. C42_A2020_038]|nr:DUF3493 domain-containing protein [Calothrix sp. C42_A2020_038]
MLQQNSNNQKNTPKPASQINSETYARLKAEAASPYRGLRKFIYISCAASGFIGAFVFFFQIIAGRDLDRTLPNFALQMGVIALMVFLWQWETRQEQQK